MTLTEFLLARIAEDEAVARNAGPDGGEWFSRHPDQPDLHMYGEFGWFVSGPNVEAEDSEWGKAVVDHIARHDPARVLAECEAKRRIVEDMRDHLDEMGGWGSLCERQLRHLAAAYADHPDYDEAWRP